MGGTLTVQGTQIGTASAPAGENVGPFSLTMGACDVATELVLAGAFQTVAVPPDANGAIIIPPPGYGGVLTLKGATGDVGTAISSVQETILSFNLTDVPATLGLTSSVAFATPPLKVRFT